MKHVGLITSLAATLLLIGCDGNNTSPTSSLSEKTLNGSIMKGPINQAQMSLIDDQGNPIAQTTSSNGTFALNLSSLDAPYYVIRSTGGNYQDEATEQTVELDAQDHLETILSQNELRDIIEKNQTVALTPETTMLSLATKALMAEGKDFDTAHRQAKDAIQNVLNDQTTPVPQLASQDKVLKVGNLVSPFPQDSAEALARNRAISLSYLVRNLGLQPDAVFSLMKTVADNLKDGRWDMEDLNGDGVDDNVTQLFAMARTQLLQDTTTRLREGNLSEGQRQELAQMGIDTQAFGDLQTQRQELDATVADLLQADDLPTLRLLPTLTDEDGNLTDNKATYTLTAYEDVNVTIEAPGRSWITPMWRYNRSPLPVVIRAKRGDAMTLHFYNRLTHESTIHWHGFKIPADMDGGPDYPVAANGGHFLYRFTMQQPAAPLWFHPHPHMQTGKQVYMGLAGVFILEDSISESLEDANRLPSGDRDVILLVQDRRFDANNTLQYMNQPMDSIGMYGDTILVNGSVTPKHEVKTVQYRYRIYNVSNARTYDFALSDGGSFTVVATDGGLLDKPVTTDHIVLGAAERAEIIIDFSRYRPGDKVALISRPFNGDMMGMMGNGQGGMGGMQGGQGGMGGMGETAQNGSGLAIMRFDITQQANDTVQLYDTLPDSAEIKTRWSADDAINVREFVMSMQGMGQGGMGGGQGGMGGMQGGQGDQNGMQGMRFVINGKLFDPTRVDEYVPANATEIWDIRNMSPMEHPFHAHAIQYQILSRNGKPAEGTDLGWKDTFLVQPGETVRVIAKFDDVNQGDYMYHCHILEHEDAGMMGYFRVGPTGRLDELQ